MNVLLSDAAISDAPAFRSVRWSRRILVFSFCAGASIGTFAVFGFSRFLPERVFSLADAASLEPIGYFPLLWTYSVPCLIAVFLSAVLFGFVLLPILFLFRGFLLSYSASLLLRSGTGTGSVCLLLGLPALFSLSALFLLGEEAFCSSLDIYRTYRGYPRIRIPFISADRLLTASLLISAAAFVRRFLIPLLK